MNWLNGDTSCGGSSQVHAMNNGVIDEERESCPICLNVISKTENYTKTSCGHSFCFSCINKCLMTSNKCPMCREKIEDEPRQKKKNLNMEDGIGMISEEIAYFDIKNHIISAMFEVEQLTTMEEKVKKMTTNMKQMTRLYSIKLLESFIAYEDDEDEEDEDEDGSYEDEEEEEEEED